MVPSSPVFPRPVVDSTRRRLLQAAALAPVLVAGCAMPRDPALSGRDPFTLGVACGDPLPDGLLLWTRLAPEPLAGGGMPARPVTVRWEVAEDERFGRPVQAGEVAALPEHAHSCHVAVGGLQPGRWYWYRFIAGGEASPVGRGRTAPAGGAGTMRFAYASCQQYEHGYYAAHRHLAAEDLDLVLFLGDYIYEASWGNNRIRDHGAPEAVTLADYRNRYALYKSDRDLQAAHAACAWAVTWDDHEVANDYADDRSEKLDPPARFLARRAAAYQAFWEHMPLRGGPPAGPNLPLHRLLRYGDLAGFLLLDDRQHRSYQPCSRPGRGGGNIVTACTDRLNPAATLLGVEQERWLDAVLARGGTRWTVLAQQTLMAQLDRRAGPEAGFWTDGWDGYPAARRRLLQGLQTHGTRNPLVIGGDVHATYVSDLTLDAADSASPVVATEICGTSITSYGPAPATLQEQLAENPHLRFADGRKGYVRASLDGRRAVFDLRAVAAPRNPASGIATIASFTVEDGRRGVQTGT